MSFIYDKNMLNDNYNIYGILSILNNVGTQFQDYISYLCFDSKFISDCVDIYNIFVVQSSTSICLVSELIDNIIVNFFTPYLNYSNNVKALLQIYIHIFITNFITSYGLLQYSEVIKNKLLTRTANKKFIDVYLHYINACYDIDMENILKNTKPN